MSTNNSCCRFLWNGNESAKSNIHESTLQYTVQNIISSQQRPAFKMEWTSYGQHRIAPVTHIWPFSTTNWNAPNFKDNFHNNLYQKLIFQKQVKSYAQKNLRYFGLYISIQVHKNWIDELRSEMYYLLGQDKRGTCHTLKSHSDSVQTSFLPGRMGLPWSNSAKMQPTDHMSTAGVYLVDPIRSSGGLRVSNNSQLVSSKKQKSWHIQIQSQAAFKMILYRGCKSDPLILGGEIRERPVIQQQWICGWSEMKTYLYQSVITRFVSGWPFWSLLNDLASPKSASFKFPLLSINKFEPGHLKIWMSVWRRWTNIMIFSYGNKKPPL